MLNIPLVAAEQDLIDSIKVEIQAKIQKSIAPSDFHWSVGAIDVDGYLNGG